MDNNINLLTSVQVHKNPTKKSTCKAKKGTNKPVKVVYISNPMKIKTSASEFRALVQELTGQDAEFPVDPTKFPGIEDGGDQHHPLVTDDPTAKIDGVVGNIFNNEDQPADSNNSSTTTASANSVHEGFDDDVFMPQMMESFVGISSSNMWYESSNYHDVIRSFDAM